jgi:hypothetical protein
MWATTFRASLVDANGPRPEHTMTKPARIALVAFLSACSTTAAGPAGPTPVDDDSGVGDETPPPDAGARRDSASTPAPSPDAASKPDLETSPPDAAPPATFPDAAQPADAGPPGAFCTANGKKLGPPTIDELKIVDAQYKANPYVPAGTNMGNNFAYGTGAKRLGEMRSMYSLTGDVWYLDQAIKFADHIMTVRNDTPTGRVLWTGKREPCWPNNADTAPDAGVCGMETGAVANQVLQTAKLIFSNRTLWDKPGGGGDPNNYGATYLQRARTYLTKSYETMDFMIAHFVDPMKGNQIHTPSDPAYGALGPNYLKALGRAVPWNQQDMLTQPLSAIGDILIMLQEDAPRVAQYDALVKVSLDWFVETLTTNQYMVNGVIVYKWGYNPGDLFHLEDTAHSSADINALYNGYKRGRFGIDRATLVPIANTFFELIAKPDGTYADHVDGKGSRTTLSTSWTNYEEFRPGIVARLVPVMTVDAMTAPPDAVTILNLRRKYCPQ